MSEESEQNRRRWDAASDAYQARHDAQLVREPAAWGVWVSPESELSLLGDVAEHDVLVTRTRENVTITYGKDEVRDFGELMARAQRDNGKGLVRDEERIVSIRFAREQEREREQKQLRGVAIEQEHEPKIPKPRQGGTSR